MQPATVHAEEEGQIRELVESWATAIRIKDAEALAAPFTSGALVFDLIEPLQAIGPDAVRARAEQWLSSFEGPLAFEVRDLNVTAGEDVAFCHSLNGVRGTKRNGEKIQMWWRATVCFRRIAGKWKVVHEHSSVPFNMKTGAASLGLKP